MTKKSPDEYPKPSLFTQFFIRLRQVFFSGSQDYWKKRYLLGGNSGKGSYGENAELRVAIDRESGEYETFRTWEVVEFEELEEMEEEINPDN